MRMLKLPLHGQAAEALGQQKEQKKLKGESRCYNTLKQHSTSSHNHMHYSVTESPPPSVNKWH